MQPDTLRMLPPFARTQVSPASATCIPRSQQWLPCCWPMEVSQCRPLVLNMASPKLLLLAYGDEPVQAAC